MTSKYKKPQAEMIGADGNIFSLIGIGLTVLRNLDLYEQDEIPFNIYQFAKSYNDTSISSLGLLMDYFSIVPLNYNYNQEDIDDDKMFSKEELYDKFGYSPLHLLISNNRRTEDFKRMNFKNDFKKMEEYLDTINNENCYGRTPIFYAKSSQDAAWLLKNGANICKKDMHGHYPISTIKNSFAQIEILKNIPENTWEKQFENKNIFGLNWLSYKFIFNEHTKNTNDTINFVMLLKDNFDNKQTNALIELQKKYSAEDFENNPKDNKELKKNDKNIDVINKKQLEESVNNFYSITNKNKENINEELLAEILYLYLKFNKPNCTNEETFKNFSKIFSNVGSSSRRAEEDEKAKIMFEMVLLKYNLNPTKPNKLKVL